MVSDEINSMIKFNNQNENLTSLANDTVLVDTTGINRLKEAEITIEKLQNELESLIKRQNIMLKIASQFINANPDNFSDIVYSTLKTIGEMLDVDRMYIVKYCVPAKTITCTHEWCNTGITSQKAYLQNYTSSAVIKWINEHKLNKAVIITDINTLPDNDPSKTSLLKQYTKSLISVPIFDIDNQVYGYVAFNSVRKNFVYNLYFEDFLRDYGEKFWSTNQRIEAYIALNKSEELFQKTLMSIGDGVISTDANGNINMMNMVAQKLTGWSIEEAFGKPLSQVFHIIDEETRLNCENPATTVINSGEVIELSNHIVLISKSGKEYFIEDSAAPIIGHDNKISGVVIVFRDGTEKKAKQRQIEYLSYNDHLTGLYNRRFIEELLINLDKKEYYPLSVMYLDINGLKLANDAFGHTVGDKLLQSVAKIIKDSMRQNDYIGRIGGDEFLIVLKNTDKEVLQILKDRIQNKCNNNSVDYIKISVAIGYESKICIEEDIQVILNIAEDEMYKDKEKNGYEMRSDTVKNIMKFISKEIENDSLYINNAIEFSNLFLDILYIDEELKNNIKSAVYFRKIGAISVCKEVSTKNTKFTPEEYEIMKKYPSNGYKILKSIKELANFADIVYYQSEHFDGNGYCEGLKGHDIPLGARVLAIINAFESMTSGRSYKEAISQEQAFDELIRCSGTQFDPELVEKFISVIKLQ